MKPTAIVMLVCAAAWIRLSASAWAPDRPLPDRKANQQKVVATPSGLKYVDLQFGEGRAARAGDSVVVHYVGNLTDGTKVDSSRDRNAPFEFKLGAGRVIKGWDEGVAGMKEGGKRKLTIPSELGYGKRGAGNDIPPDATLIFEIELLEGEVITSRIAAGMPRLPPTPRRCRRAP